VIFSQTTQTVSYIAAILVRGGDPPILGPIIGVIFLVFLLIAWALGLGKRDPNKMVWKDELLEMRLLLGIETQHSPVSISALQFHRH